MKALKFLNGCLIPDKKGNRILVDNIIICDETGKHLRNIKIADAYKILFDKDTFIVVNPKFDELVQVNEVTKPKDEK